MSIPDISHDDIKLSFEKFSKRHAQKGARQECWPWTGKTSEGGYGYIYVGRRWLLAHRVSWQVCNGAIPKGMCICHTCDNPSCVNPDHLWLGTHADNMADMVRKGRSMNHEGRRKGENNPNAKLTKQKVAEIRRLAEKGVTRTATAEQFSVSPTTITDIVKGRRWQ